MTHNELEDILKMARRESARAGHFYVGIEHLFISLTKLSEGIAATALEEIGVTPRFVRYMIRQELGRGDNRRFWPGFRETPRLHKVLGLAREMASQRDDLYPDQRDLFLAILQEGDSLPVRVLRNMEVDLQVLRHLTTEWSIDSRVSQPAVNVQPLDNVVITPAEGKVLEQMFRGYERVDVERDLRGGFTGARVLVACPYKVDGRADAPVVVKIDQRHSVLYEKMRYDSFVKDTLPPATARLMDSPVVPDQLTLGGLKYTFVRGTSDHDPIDLQAYAAANGPEALGELLWGLYRVFGATWWRQNQPYYFTAWQEYEFLLPPALILDAVEQPRTPHHQLRPMDSWSRRVRFSPGEIVLLEGMAVRRVYHDESAIQLAAGAGDAASNSAGKVRVDGVDLSVGEYYQGNTIPQLAGRVRATRSDLLAAQIRALDPDFDLSLDWLPRRGALDVLLPNPLQRYANLLERQVPGSQSIIHGDLHLRNILVGPGHNPWLIDFALTREGHTLFDWAVLEASLLTEIVSPVIQSDSWDDVWAIMRLLTDTAALEDGASGTTAVERALVPVAVVRRIAEDCLAVPGNWSEYYIALAICALRVLGWPTVSLKARRLLFLVSALAIASASARFDPGTDGHDIDKTDLDINLRFRDMPTDTNN